MHQQPHFTQGDSVTPDSSLIFNKTSPPSPPIITQPILHSDSTATVPASEIPAVPVRSPSDVESSAPATTATSATSTTATGNPPKFDLESRQLTAFQRAKLAGLSANWERYNQLHAEVWAMAKSKVSSDLWHIVDGHADRTLEIVQQRYSAAIKRVITGTSAAFPHSEIRPEWEFPDETTTIEHQALDLWERSSEANPVEVDSSSGSEAEAQEPLAGKKRVRIMLSPKQRQRLTAWFMKHVQDPYPTTAKKVKLANELKVDPKQVNTWFVNHRQRYKKKHQSPVAHILFANQGFC
ncbi:hypothetical protein Pelo_8830 [Pelomyxa schiedti]|nr:hypothetical protein Pelo_8830 [Pelomyxa schiedti]